MKGVVLVTGASRGIGLEFARQFSGDGWRVHACCRNADRADALSRLAAKAGGLVSVHALDVTQPDRARTLAAELGSEAVDMLINNAGVYGRDADSFGAVDADAWLEALRVNTIAPLKVSEAFADHVARSRRRVIATITSLMGSLADNTSGGHYAYRTSKAAVNMVARSMAVDLRRRGITVVVLNPGWVRTDMGGPSAPTSVEESVAGMRWVLEGLTLRDSGSFIDFDGEPLPW